MRSSFVKLILCAVLAFFAGSAIYRIMGIERSVSEALAVERARMRSKGRVPVDKTELAPHDQDRVEIIQNTRETRDIAFFQDSFFAASSGGLVQMSPEGKMVRHFTVLDGLPESSLTCLAVFDGRLYIGTQTKGLIVFDGERFTGYKFTDREAQAITSFLVDDGRLLIGSFNGGLIEFDGKVFTEIRSGKDRIVAVNCLRRVGAALFVGTFNNGIFVYENDIWSHFTTAEGLPSNRVVGIEVLNDTIFAATDFGLAVMENGGFRTAATIPALSSMAIDDGRLVLSKDEGEILRYDQGIREISPGAGLEHSRLVRTAGKLYLASSGGILVRDGARFKPFFEAAGTISDNFTSAMAIDHEGQLYAGTFRHGIDLLSTGGGKLKHFESETIREINYLKVSNEGISAATSAGLVFFGPDGSQSVVAAKDGLPSNTVTHFSDSFIATDRGLAFRDSGRIRVLTTVQGLPGNSVYATLRIGEKLYAGTLGGLAEVEGGRVVRTFNDSNSRLATNWVTALCLADGRLFIGTYGGGVFELSPSGEIRSFEPETGKFTVNPNAIYTDGERLYTGSLTGIRTLDLQTQEWKTTKNILPDETVMSITGDAESIYFGTTAGIARVAKAYFGEN